MAVVDLVFRVIGLRLPTDHAYSAYAACCRLLPCLHDGTVRFGLAPVTGPYIGNGLLQIDPASSRLRLRLSSSSVPRVMPLAGKEMELSGHRIRLGSPHIEALKPARTLGARTVAIKNATEVGPFCEAARKQLDQLGVGGRLCVPEHIAKTGQREPRRRVVRIKDACIICFPLLVAGLQPEESLRLQEVGLGGRRHMGCGLFLPRRVEENGHAD